MSEQSDEFINRNCICCKKMSDDNLRDVFDDELLIRLQKRECKAMEEFMTLREAIEVITGYGIMQIDDAILCKTCFRKVESYVRFRSHLVTLFTKLSDTYIPDLDSSSENITDTSLNSQESQVSAFTAGVYADEVGNEISGNENSDVQNNASNDSDISSSDIDDNLNLESSRSKIRKSDIESDVNVCSGEDDEVLKYVENKNSKTVSISSTESEEEYDYGPTFKKIKLSNRVSSPLIS